MRKSLVAIIFILWGSIFMLCPLSAFCEDNNKNKLDHDIEYFIRYDMMGMRNCLLSLGYGELAKTKSEFKVVEGLKNIAQQKPYDPIPYSFKGMIYEYYNLIFDAKAAYEKAETLNKDDSYLCGQRLETFLSKRLTNINKIIRDIEGEIGKPESNSEEDKIKIALQAIKKSEQVSGLELEKAIFYNSYAINLLPNNPEIAMAYCNLGGIFAYAGRAEFEIYYFKKAAELNNELAEAYMGLTYAYASLQAFPSAFWPQDYEQGKEQTFYNRAIFLLNKQGREQELKDFEKTLNFIRSPKH